MTCTTVIRYTATLAAWHSAALCAMAPSLLCAAAPGRSADAIALFDMDGQQIIQRPEHVGIANGMLTVGVDYPDAASLQGLWAPPYVSSDFHLECRLNGQPVPTTKWLWRPFQVEREGGDGPVSISIVTTLIYGQRAAVVHFALRNASDDSVACELSACGTLDLVTEWGFAQPRSTTAPTLQANGRQLTLRQGPHAIVLDLVAAEGNWQVSGNRGRAVVSLPAGQSCAVTLVVAIGSHDQAAASATLLARDPVAAVAAAHAEYAERVGQIRQRLPSLESRSAPLVNWYNRSLVHLLMNRWDVPQFVLQPYYATGSVCGGCVTEYLWNYGEAWQLMPLYDPVAHRRHIAQFLQCDMTAHFAFNPVDGQPHGPWYMVNQEKLIGLVDQYVRITGDTGFLAEMVNGKTVLEHVIQSAMWLDDGSKRVELIDYGPSGAHLELGWPGANGHDAPQAYNHVMPDLNGRRYANYLRAARLAEIAGQSAPYLDERAAALKVLLKQRLWNPESQWFEFINGEGRRETRWTVQMFYLVGSGVLDRDMETGLVGHLNEDEFLGPYGVHSLAQGDPFYNPADVDNGGPGACTCFPPNIAVLLYKAGWPRQAEDILRRCLWWGERMPYWGDSIYADRIDYRQDTPLQCTLDGVAAAQCIIFGMFGVDPQLDGSIRIRPQPAAFAGRTALRALRLHDLVIDIELDAQKLAVTVADQTVSAPVGHTIVIRREGSQVTVTDQAD